MSEAGGIGRGSPANQSPEIKKMESGPEGEKVANVLHEKVKNLGQLKQMLVKNLGEKEGDKLYNSFLTSFAMIMLEQIQHSAQKAKQAAQQARMGPQ